jgi:hypothetical protein
MLVYCVQKVPSVTCCSILAAKIKRLGSIAIIVYTPYMWAHILYTFSRDSMKYSECIYKGVACNSNFLEADFDKLLEERAYLEAA